MKVYIIAQRDFECGGQISGKAFDSEDKAKKYIDECNSELYNGWVEFARDKCGEYLKMKIREYGSPEAYAKHMREQEEYFYYTVDVE